jgi:hypothetical protein
LADELTLDKIEKIVRDVQPLRDSLDDGSGEVAQRRSRKKRAIYVDSMLAVIRESHAELSRLTRDAPSAR